MNIKSENTCLELVSIDPELERLYREHAIAAALNGQISQPQINPDLLKEVDHNLEIEPIDDFSSTFPKL